jgi:hypothetical protein
MKQTAVEWFLTEFQKQVWFEANSELDIWVKGLIPKAKEMEKEQIIDAYVYGSAYGIDFQEGLSPINYYNETYESNN